MIWYSIAKYDVNASVEFLQMLALLLCFGTVICIIAFFLIIKKICYSPAESPLDSIQNYSSKQGT